MAQASPHQMTRLPRKLQFSLNGVIIAVPFYWLLIFFLAPFIIVFKISVAEPLIASPPFSSLFSIAQNGALSVHLVFDNYAYLWEDSLYISTYVNSIRISTISTVLCLLLGYPIAYAIVRSAPTTRFVLLMLIILPFWTSFLLRIYAWMGLLADQGTINNILIYLGLINRPIRLMYSEFAVHIGIVYSYLPFMILPTVIT
jgi:putrescine transport system permease protein